ncbi:MAG: DMT family transporter [Ilumatobacteraceae bacterium]|nr:DMT family transporter [Ilumatobacteraceae bacterium]
MRRIGIVRCLLAAVLFGATAPLASQLAGSIPTFTLAGLLYVGAAVAVAPSVVRRPPAARALRAEWRPALVAVVAGGAIGPLLLVAGLARTSAATGSILLNAELAATVVLAALVFGEHIGHRLWLGTGLITVAGVLLTWRPGVEVDVGALLVVAACVAWGIDNGVTAGIEQLAPEHVVALKGTVAGGANLLIGLIVAGWGATTSPGDVLAALAIGAAGYGLSITLWVKGARDLGAARAQVIFAMAPFIGAAIAWTVLGEDATAVEVMSAALAGLGVAVAMRSVHSHDHVHDDREHDHEHGHDDGHHDHAHHPDFAGDVAGRHAHLHRHRVVGHAHPHVPDLHHRH